MLSLPLFRVGDVPSAGYEQPTFYTIVDVGGCHQQDIYLLSAPHNMCRFDYRIFREGERIYSLLRDADGVR